MTARKTDRGNPWNGLRTYVEGEVIYGRSEEIHVLSLLILQNSQTVVYGRSGIGKSSLLNAGIFPRVREKGVLPVYVRFEHNVAASYLDQIRGAIDRETERHGIVARRLVDRSSRGEETLWEYFHSLELTGPDGRSVRPMVVFDQFEEIFTLETDRGKRRRFFEDLAHLVNNVMPEGLFASPGSEGQEGTAKAEGNLLPEIPQGAEPGLDLGLDLLGDTDFGYKEGSDFHLVFTLREDFLSYFERATTDIPALKNGRYSLRPINEEQAAEIIMKPRAGLVDTSVARLIIEKVTGEKDFELDGVPQLNVDSAILSLYLSRLYEKMEAEGASAITADLVEAHSANIIEDFYSDAVGALPAGAVEWMEDTLVNKEGRRDNRDRTTVLDESGLTEAELDSLIHDVKLLRQFSYGGNLRVEYIHDVLCPVVVRRRARRGEQRRIQEIEERGRAEKRRARRRLLAVVGVFLALAILGTGLWLFNSYQNVWEKSAYYTGFRLDGGWPVGTGSPLGEAERQTTPLYYKLSKKGHSDGPFTTVEVMSSNTMLPRRVRLPWPDVSTDPGDLRGNAYNAVLSAVKTLRFEAGEDDGISRMVLYGEDDTPLLVMSYFHTGPREAWIQFLAPDGQAFSIRDHEIDRMKVGWDSLGRVSSQRYFTALGNALPLDADKVSGFLWEYPAEGVVTRYYLNNYGQPVQEKDYNRVTVATRGDTVETRYARARVIGDPGVEAPGDRGFAREVAHGDVVELYLPGNSSRAAIARLEKDRRGNTLSLRVEGTRPDRYPPYVVWKYEGATGLETERRNMNTDGTLFGAPGEPALWTFDYSPTGDPVREERFASDGSLLYSHTTETSDGPKWVVTRDRLVDRPAGRFLTKVDSVWKDGRRSSTAFYGEGDMPVNSKVSWGLDSISSHWIERERDGNVITERYYVMTPDGHVAPQPTVEDPSTYRVTAFRRAVTVEGGDTVGMEISDASGRILKRMLYVVRDGETIGRAARSVIDGKAVRCPRWEEEGYGYYMLYFSKNFARDYSGLKTFDEFWNYSTLVDGDRYYIIDFKDFQGQPFQESNVHLKSHYWTNLMEYDPDVTDVEVPYLHLLSRGSALYRAGLLDGDRLMKVGAWRLGMSGEALAREWRRLASDGSVVEVEVLRPEGGALKRHSFVVGGDSREADRSEYHVFRLSGQEKKTFERYAH